MKKLIVLLILAVILTDSTCFAFTSDGIYDMAYPFCENGYARVVYSGKWRIINSEGEFVKDIAYDYLGDISQNRIKFKKGELYGFLDSELSEVIEPSFSCAEDFSEGFAAVSDESGKWGFIAENGKPLTQFIFDEASSFADGYARVRSGESYGYIDANGEIKISPQFTECYDFSCGLAAVCIDGKYGFIDKEGNIKIEAKYAAVWDFCEDLAAVKEDELWSFIDTTGNTKITGNFDRATRFSEGLAPVRLAGGKYGLINKDGKLVIPHKYDYISEFKDGFAYFRINETYGYINEAGLTVIPAIFSRAGTFSNGYALAGTGEKVGYIDKTGNFYKKPEFLDGGSYSCGVANVLYENGLWGYIDFTEKSVSVPKEETTALAPEIISNGTNAIKLKIGDKKIIVNGEENTLIYPPVIKEERTLLPIRAVVEAAGGSVLWEESSKKITINCNDSKIVLTVSSSLARVNNRIVPLEVAPEIYDGTTLVPLRFVAENLGMGIKWNGESGEITLYY